MTNNMKELFKWLLMGFVAVLVVSCGGESQESEKKTSKSKSTVNVALHLDDAMKVISFEYVGDEEIDEKLDELRVITYEARRCETLSELLDYQDKTYNEVMKAFEPQYKEKKKKLSKSQIKKYAVAQQKMEEYFNQLMLAAHKEDVKKTQKDKTKGDVKPQSKI